MIEAALVIGMAVPFAASALLTILRIRSERVVARLALGATTLSFAASALAVVVWIAGGAAAFRTTPRVLFSHDDYRFTFVLVLDGASATFLALSQFITEMVMRFSRFYLHREPGFRRFFAIVLLFQSAMCLLTLAGNLGLMFAGWEMVGLSSFLLIAFYQERQSAVRAALKTYSTYRIADIGMLFAAALQAMGARAGLGFSLLLAAMGKSAQVPFSFWVPRAMEGPTPSSALFYGALSVHAGAYLLLRTFELWSGTLAVRIAVGAVGVATAILCSMFSRVQTTIKGQIGYASVSQVGIIFLEIALGLKWIALVHVVCHALLRCYQLLVSPSVVAHRLRRQATAGGARAEGSRSLYARLVPGRLWPTLYVFALSEGYFKDVLQAAVWFPLRGLGKWLLRRRSAIVLLGAGVAAVGFAFREGAHGVALATGTFVMLCALGFSACGLAAWRRPVRALAWLSGSSLCAAAGVAAVSGQRHDFGVLYYGLGIGISFALAAGGILLSAPSGPVARFWGGAAQRPLAASVSLMGALGVAGLPLMPTFWGEDLLLDAVLGQFRGFSLALAAIFALNGYLAVRNFAYTFFGRPERAVAHPLEPGLYAVGLETRNPGHLTMTGVPVEHESPVS